MKGKINVALCCKIALCFNYHILPIWIWPSTHNFYCPPWHLRVLVMVLNKSLLVQNYCKHGCLKIFLKLLNVVIICRSPYNRRYPVNRSVQSLDLEAPFIFYWVVVVVFLTCQLQWQYFTHKVTSHTEDANCCDQACEQIITTSSKYRICWTWSN